MNQPKKEYTTNDYVRFIAGSLREIAIQLKTLNEISLSKNSSSYQKNSDENEFKF